MDHLRSCNLAKFEVLADESSVLPCGRSWQTWYATLKSNFKSFTPPERQFKQELPWFLLERGNISVIIRDAWKGQIVFGDSTLQRGIGNSLYYTLLESWSVWKFESKCLSKNLTSGKTHCTTSFIRLGCVRRLGFKVGTHEGTIRRE